MTAVEVYHYRSGGVSRLRWRCVTTAVVWGLMGITLVIHNTFTLCVHNILYSRLLVVAGDIGGLFYIFEIKKRCAK